MKQISLKEFKSISLISSDALLWLIENNALPFSYDPENGLLVDIDSVETKDLLKAISIERQAIADREINLLSEQAGKIIRDNFDSIVSEALARIKQQQG